MDNNQNEAQDLTLQGIAIRPTMNSSRPNSARRDSQSKLPTTPSREGKLISI